MKVPVKSVRSSTASNRAVLKPDSENVIVYVPGLRSTMRYVPSAPVTSLLLPSMSTGLATSTVTPGSTAPLVSLTVPVNPLCAYASGEARTTRAQTRIADLQPRLTIPDIAPPLRVEQPNGMKAAEPG